MGINPDEFWNLTWEEYFLLRKHHYNELRALYIQRQILTRLINGVPVGWVKKFGRNRPSKVMPFDEDKGVKDRYDEMLELIKKDPAFKPGMIYVKGVGLVNKKEWQRQQN